MVCEKEYLVIWIQNCYWIGLIIGYFTTGRCGDKFGIKTTAMAFISLQCLTGLLMLSIKNLPVLFFFVLSHGFVCTSLNLIPTIAGK